ncbi:Uncharacterised protein r2_g4282 [Pycnogonum litorale]
MPLANIYIAIVRAFGKPETGRKSRSLFSSIKRTDSINSSPTIPVNISGWPSIGLLDFGSTLSIIPSAYYNFICSIHPDVLKPEQVEISIGDGRQISTVGTVNFNIEIFEKSLTHTFTVLANVVHPVIIGCDLLKHFNINSSFRNNSWHI